MATDEEKRACEKFTAQIEKNLKWFIEDLDQQIRELRARQDAARAVAQSIDTLLRNVQNGAEL